MKKVFLAIAMLVFCFCANADSTPYHMQLYFQAPALEMDKIAWTVFPDDGAPCLLKAAGMDTEVACLKLGAGLHQTTDTIGVTPFDFGAPSARMLSVSTEYAAATPAKAAVFSVSPQCSTTVSDTVSGDTCELQARVAPDTVSCSTGTVVAQWTSANSGTLSTGLSVTQSMGAPADIKLPIGYRMILCAVSGTFTLPIVVEYSAG